MTSPFDPELSAVERMLTDRALQPPPPALRSRVLTAVEEVLYDDRPMRRAAPAGGSEWLPVGVLLATALSLLIIAMLASEAASRRVNSATDRPLLSFAQRAEAAGITLDAMPPATVQLAGGLPYDTEIPRHNDTLHVLNTRSFLQGDL